MSKRLLSFFTIVSYLSILLSAPYGVKSQDDGDDDSIEDLRESRQTGLGWCGNMNDNSCRQYCRGQGFQNHLCTANKCTCQSSSGGGNGFCGNYNDASCRQYCQGRGFPNHRCTNTQCTCQSSGGGCNNGQGGNCQGGGNGQGGNGFCGNYNNSTCRQYCQGRGFPNHRCTNTQCTCQSSGSGGNGQGGNCQGLNCQGNCQGRNCQGGNGQGGNGYCGNYNDSTCRQYCQGRGFSNHLCTSTKCTCQSSWQGRRK